MKQNRMSPLPLLLVIGLLASACRSENNADSAAPDWLLERAKQQRERVVHTSILLDFRFTDRRSASGITFVNRVVDDATRDYKAVHYDHGTGLAVADVDGDGLTDIYFVSQLGSSELWKNLGNGRFSDMTDGAGLRLPDIVAVGASFADTDNDGDADLFVTTVRHGNRLFENTGGTFRDISAAAGVAYVGHSSGATFFDYDRDGRLDLFVSNVGGYTTEQKGRGDYYVALTDAFEGHLHPDRSETSILYRNLGENRFEDVTRGVGLVDSSWTGDATAIDANDDGFLDLYVLNMQGKNRLWLNEAGKRFRDGTAEFFPRTPWGAMGVKAFDFDGNGHLDLLVTDMHSDMFVNLPPGDWIAEARKSDFWEAKPGMIVGRPAQFIFGNALFAKGDSVARGRAPFKEVSDAVGVETYGPWGPSVDDLNADGWDDIFMASSMNFPYRYGINSVLMNQLGKGFMPNEFSLGVEPRLRGETEQEWYTLDCAGADRGHLSCGKCREPNAAAQGCRGDPNGRLTMMAARGTRAAVIFDLDNDGDLDIVTNEFNAAPQVFVSNLITRRRINFIKVRLRGTKSNRQGIGAEVTLVLPDGRRVLKVNDGKSGYLSQSALPLYFGLAHLKEGSSLEVRWPSGARQTVQGPLRAGSTVEVVEP